MQGMFEQDSDTPASNSDYTESEYSFMRSRGSERWESARFAEVTSPGEGRIAQVSC